MYTLFMVLIFIVSALLILIVLVQNSKGGGLASNFSSSNAHMGVRKTADFLEKATWTLAVSLMLFSVMASMTIDHDKDGNQPMIQEQIDNTINRSSAIPNLPTTTGNEQTGADGNSEGENTDGE